jgi:uroporphyrinogen decarboxylase
VIGVDWRTPLADAIARLGDGVAVQGNLDPLVLDAPRALLSRRVDEVLAAANNRLGHVFNLGHGILPETSPDAAKFVVDYVHERSRR